VEKLSERKSARRTPKNRTVKNLEQTPEAVVAGVKRPMDAQLLAIVGEYCQKFLSRAYDKLIRVVKDMVS